MTDPSAPFDPLALEPEDGPTNEIPPPSPSMQFFSYGHLPLHLQEVSEAFATLACHIVSTLPDNPQREAALTKLLESKDCAVRARLFK